MPQLIQIRRGNNPITTQLAAGEPAVDFSTPAVAIGRGVGQPAIRLAVYDDWSTNYSVLVANTAKAPTAVSLGQNTVLGRLTGNITALTGADLWGVLSGQATSPVSLNGQRITHLGTPASDFDAANKFYVDSVASGLKVKAAVRCATTGPITLSGLLTIDGVSVQPGDRVLVKDQTNPAQNGIYVVSTGAWTRAPDMDSADEVPHSFVFVQEGQTNAHTGWVCTNEPENIVLGSTPITFAQFSGAGFVNAGTGLSKTGNVLSVAGFLATLYNLGGPSGKGHLMVGSGSGAVSWLTPGPNGTVLVADSNEPLGVKWSSIPPSVTTFLGLTDTPSSYSGYGGYLVAVNSAGTALEFVNVIDGGTL